MAKNANFVSHKKSKQIIDGKPKLPLASDLVEGEIAINFGKDVETISIKNESGDVVTFSSDNYYTDKKLGSGFTGENSGVTVTEALENVEITVDQVIDSGTSASTNAVATKAVYNAITDNELVWSMAYTALSGTVSSHTENTEIHVTTADKEKLHTHSNKSSLDSITGNVGTMAYEDKASYSSATEVNTALGNKANTASTLAGYGITNAYTKSETSGATELATAFNGKTNTATTTALNNVVTAHTANTTIHVTQADRDRWDNAGGGFVEVTNPTDSEKKGLVNKLSQYYDTNIGKGAVIEGNGYEYNGTSYNIVASGDYSHAEGFYVKANGTYSHAEGYDTIASGNYGSHAEGSVTQANGDYSHAEGIYTTASGNYSHAEGSNTQANNEAEHASGQYNVSSKYSNTFGDSSNTLFSVGNGTSTTERHNAFEIRQNGDIYISSGGTITSQMIKLQDSLGVDLSNYYTKSETSGATELTTAFAAKANTTDLANFFDNAKYEDSGSTKVINFYHGNTIKATIDASNFIKDGMVEDVRIENGNLVIDFNTASGKQDISIPLTDIFDPSNYYNKTAIDNLVGSGFTSSSITEVIIENEEIVSAALNDLNERKLDVSAYTPTDLSNYYTKSETSGATQISNALSAKANTATTLAGYGITNAYTKSETSGATQISNALGAKVNSVTYNAHTANTTIHVTQAEKDKWNNGTGGGGFIEVTNPTASTKVGLVSKLSQNYATYIGKGAVIEGYGTSSRITASGYYSHAEGGNTKAIGDCSHAEGYGATASGSFSHAEGRNTTASGDYSHAEGDGTKANGNHSHAEGDDTKASGNYGSHAEGSGTTANGNSSHAEGQSTSATSISSHAEGYSTLASGESSHAEGCYTSAMTSHSHAEGYYTKASGNRSHAEGCYTSAMTSYSHAEGYYTVANNQSEHASGQYNVSSSASTTFGNAGNTLFSIGNGTYNARHNAFEIRQNGDIYITSGNSDIKLQDYIGTDLSNYYTKSETSGKTEISTALSNKADKTVVDDLSGQSETVAAALVDLNTKITTYNRRTRIDFTSNGLGWFKTTLKSAIADKSLEKYGLKVGDYYTATHDGKKYNYVIAGLNTMKGTVASYRLKYDHVGIIVDTNDTHAWNTSNSTTASTNTHSTDGTWTIGTSAAGYASCDLQYYLETTVLPNVESDLGSDNIKSHYKIYPNAVDTSGYNRYGSPGGCSSYWNWYANQKICALSEVQVYGSIVWSSSGHDTGEACRQLDVFRVYNMNEIFEDCYPWLRDVASSSRACFVTRYGYPGRADANAANHVAALILFA